MTDPNVKPQVEGDLPGIIAELGELKSGAIITEEGMIGLFNRCGRSIKRAIARGELPPPIRMFGQNTWTVGKIVQHIEARLEAVAKEREDLEQKIKRLSP